jgi:chemotaxis protein CheD
MAWIKSVIYPVILFVRIMFLFAFEICNLKTMYTPEPAIFTHSSHYHRQIPEYRIVDVQTGEVKVGGDRAVISSTAIGSCIAIVAIDPQAGIGGIAHIMLPGKAPGWVDGPKTRYAHDGLFYLVKSLLQFGARRELIKVCLVGGANVLLDPEDSVCRDNCASVFALCAGYRLTVCAQSLGGFKRRRVLLDVEKNMVFCGIGDNSDFILWSDRKDSAR